MALSATAAGSLCIWVDANLPGTYTGGEPIQVGIRPAPINIRIVFEGTMVPEPSMLLLGGCGLSRTGICRAAPTDGLIAAQQKSLGLAGQVPSRGSLECKVSLAGLTLTHRPRVVNYPPAGVFAVLPDAD